MKTILQHIETTTYKPVYLLYGEEDYLKEQACRQLKNALVAADDTMNLCTFQGKGQDENAIIQLSQTLPFFQEHRVILLEETGLAGKCSDEFLDNLKELPDTTVIIMVEESVDKRSRLYKWIQKNGYPVEFSYQDEKSLRQWVQDQLKEDGKTMDGAAMHLLLERTDGKMTAIENELQKLVLYAGDREKITADDVKELVPEPVNNQIFRMIAAVSEGRPEQALDYYYDLLSLKEPPMRILFLMVREFNMLFRVKNLAQQGRPDGEIAKTIGTPPFAVKKYRATGKQYTYAALKNQLSRCAEMENLVKNGNMNERIAIELLILQFSNRLVTSD